MQQVWTPMPGQATRRETWLERLRMPQGANYRGRVPQGFVWIASSSRLAPFELHGVLAALAEQTIAKRTA
jgi:hypothetical protein